MNLKKQTLSLVLSCFLLGCGQTATTHLANNEFTPLLNKNDLKGWHLKIKGNDPDLAKQVFTIKNGIVHVFGAPFSGDIDLNEGTDATIGMMYTHKEYEKFHLKFEYKWGTKKANYFDKWQYDAGVYFNIIDDKIFPTGIEYQIHYDHIKNENHTGDSIAPRGVSYDWYADPKTMNYAHPNDGGKLSKKGRYRAWLHNAQATNNYHALNGGWNTVEIISMGNEYVIYKLNGDVINMLFNPSPSKGIIGFQSETAEIFYRDIKIKEFDKNVPAEFFLNQAPQAI